MKEYGPAYSAGSVTRRSDFCIMVRPEEREQEVIDYLRIDRPGQSINFVSSTKRYPIYSTVSMTSPGGPYGSETRRTTIWHTLQWRNLQWGNDGNTYSKLQCGIIVRGHEWQFSASIPVDSGACMVLGTSCH